MRCYPFASYARITAWRQKNHLVIELGVRTPSDIFAELSDVAASIRDGIHGGRHSATNIALRFERYGHSVPPLILYYYYSIMAYVTPGAVHPRKRHLPLTPFPNSGLTWIQINPEEVQGDCNAAGI